MRGYANQEIGISHQMPFNLISDCEKVFQCLVKLELSLTCFPVDSKDYELILITVHTNDPVSICALWLMFADEILIKF